MRGRAFLLGSALALAGCGGSSAEAPTQSGTENALTITEAAPTTSQGAAPAAPSRAKPAKKGYVASLTATGHTTLVGQPWRFTIRTHTRTQRPVGGTIIAQVLLGGRVIDTVGWFKYSRELSREYTYGDADRGKTVIFRARIIAEGSTRELTYSVKVI